MNTKPSLYFKNIKTVKTKFKFHVFKEIEPIIKRLLDIFFSLVEYWILYLAIYSTILENNSNTVFWNRKYVTFLFGIELVGKVCGLCKHVLKIWNFRLFSDHIISWGSLKCYLSLSNLKSPFSTYNFVVNLF